MSGPEAREHILLNMEVHFISSTNRMTRRMVQGSRLAIFQENQYLKKKTRCSRPSTQSSSSSESSCCRNLQPDMRRSGCWNQGQRNFTTNQQWSCAGENLFLEPTMNLEQHSGNKRVHLCGQNMNNSFKKEMCSNMIYDASNDFRGTIANFWQFEQARACSREKQSTSANCVKSQRFWHESFCQKSSPCPNNGRRYKITGGYVRGQLTYAEHQSSDVQVNHSLVHQMTSQRDRSQLDAQRLFQKLKDENKKNERWQASAEKSDKKPSAT